jgi:pyruvate dehydrogenase E2 component (dihydrolipoyllysine-residue acetyltransferase)
MGEFRMPSLGADMTAGTLTEWYKRAGDPVRRGDIVACVDTDKGSIDVEVFEDGVIERLLVEPGRKVPVGTVLALIRGSEAAPAAAAPAPPPPAAPPPGPAPATAPPPAPTGEVRVSPLARKLAAELGVDLAGVMGTGPGGAIGKADVERAAQGPPSPVAAGEAARIRMRRAIAALMTRSTREIPHFYLSSTLDFGAASAWLSARNASVGPENRLLPAVLLLKAAARALAGFPELNARWEDDRVVPAQAVHLGIATSLRSGGLVVPTVHDADKKTLEVLMRELREVVQRARNGELRSSDLADSTITVTSLGDRGADAVFGVIYPPQTALIGFGTVVVRPWVVEGQVIPRPVVTATLAADHRASDGHRGGLFLTAIGQLLERPEAL